MQINKFSVSENIRGLNPEMVVVNTHLQIKAILKQLYGSVFSATTRCRRRGAEIGSNFAAQKAKTKPQPYGHGFCFVVNDGGRNCGLRFSITVNIMPLFATLHLLLRKKMMCSPAYI